MVQKYDPKKAVAVMDWIIPVIRFLALVIVVTLTLQCGAGILRVFLVMLCLGIIAYKDPVQQGPDRIIL